jgi:hypothetical protein
MHAKFYSHNLKGGIHFEVPEMDGRTLFERILKKQM